MLIKNLFIRSKLLVENLKFEKKILKYNRRNVLMVKLDNNFLIEWKIFFVGVLF